jgi:hypothetical protein
MQTDMRIYSPQRHPWLAEIESSPTAALDDLVRGYAAIPPYERADAPDAARQLFGSLEPDDAARQALDAAIIDWIKQCRQKPIPTDQRSRGRMIREVSEVFEITAVLEMPKAARWSLNHRMRLTDWTAGLIDGPARDARAALLRMLALTQQLVADEGENTNLAPIWMDICRNAGGHLRKYYLDIGLLGLRRLPQMQYQATETPWLAGLAHWALAHDPTENEFNSEWRPLKKLYPRAPKVWRKEVGQLLRTAFFREAGIEPPQWWGADPELAPLGLDAAHLPGALLSPLPEEGNQLIGRLDGSYDTKLDGKIDDFMRRHVRFARATGDSQYLARAVHLLSIAAVNNGGATHLAKAQEMARTGLKWQPFNGRLWGIWADALETAGALNASETVRWESVRRIPFDIERRNQLAEFLIAGGRLAEARDIVDNCFAEGLGDGATHALRVRLAANLDGPDGARDAVEAGLKNFPNNSVLSEFSMILSTGKETGKEIWLPSRRYLERPLVQSDAAEAAVFADIAEFATLARCRRIANAESDDAVSEVKRILRDEPEFAYAQLLAARIGIWQQDSDVPPSFAAAFEQALSMRDRETLERLVERAPRLEALILLARAIFGDAAAQKNISEWLRETASSGIVTLDAFRNQVRSVLGERVAPADIATVLHDKQDILILNLRRANEALLADSLLAA